MDPAVADDAETLPFIRLLYQGLLDADDDVKLVPALAAEMPAVSDDKKTYTFRLRAGIRFANGRELEAADFVYALERTLDPATKSPWPSFLRNIRGARDFEEARKQRTPTAHVAGLTALDRLTLRIELEKPDLAFLWVLTLPYTYAVPREEVERRGDEFYRHPCGTGPFVLAGVAARPAAALRAQPVLRPAQPAWLRRLRGPGRLRRDDAVDDVRTRATWTSCPVFRSRTMSVSCAIRAWRPYVQSLQIQETNFLVMNTEMDPFQDLPRAAGGLPRRGPGRGS